MANGSDASRLSGVLLIARLIPTRLNLLRLLSTMPLIQSVGRGSDPAREAQAVEHVIFLNCRINLVSRAGEM